MLSFAKLLLKPDVASTTTRRSTSSKGSPPPSPTSFGFGVRRSQYFVSYGLSSPRLPTFQRQQGYVLNVWSYLGISHVRC